MGDDDLAEIRAKRMAELQAMVGLLQDLNIIASPNPVSHQKAPEREIMPGLLYFSLRQQIFK